MLKCDFDYCGGDFCFLSRQPYIFFQGFALSLLFAWAGRCRPGHAQEGVETQQSLWRIIDLTAAPGL